MTNAPAKRAAYLMIAIGVLILAGSFVSTMFALLRPEWIDAQLAPNKSMLESNPLFERPALTWVIAVSGGLGLIESGISIGLGMWILRGKRWAITTSLVLTVFRLIVVGMFGLLLVLAASIVKATPDSNAAKGGIDLSSVVGSLVATVVLLVLLVWLVQALRIDRRAKKPTSMAC